MTLFINKSLFSKLHFRRAMKYWSTPRYLTYTQSVPTYEIALHRYWIGYESHSLLQSLIATRLVYFYPSSMIRFRQTSTGTTASCQYCFRLLIANARSERRTKEYEDKEERNLPLMVIGHVISNMDAKSNGNEEERKCRRTRGMKCRRLRRWYEKETFRRYEYQVTLQHAEEDSRWWKQRWIFQTCGSNWRLTLLLSKKLLRAPCT